jgi:hypothetical protein
MAKRLSEGGSSMNQPRQNGRSHIVRRLAFGSSLAAVAVLAAMTVGSGSAATQAAPSNTAPPTISGTPQVGQTLTASTGTWSPTPSSFSYQWRRCDQNGGSCANISGAQSKSYTLTSADNGNTLRVRVTASNSSGESASATSTPTAVIKPIPISAPQKTSSPTVSGTPKQGETLTVSNGSWTGKQPISFSYQWLRCNSNGDSCIELAGATTQTYVLVAADVGATMRARVTAKNSDGENAATTVPTATIAKASAPAGAAVSINDVSLPNRLIVSGVSFSPNPLRTHDSVVARFRVTDSQGHPVQGALVFVLGVPYGKFATPAEQATGADGYATFSLNPTRRLQLQRGGAMVFFVRARKPGENKLGGVSTRRLVQLNLAA